MVLKIGSEGTYGGYTAPIADFVASRRAGLERAIAFAKVERENARNG